MHTGGLSEHSGSSIYITELLLALPPQEISDFYSHTKEWLTHGSGVSWARCSNIELVEQHASLCIYKHFLPENFLL